VVNPAQELLAIFRRLYRRFGPQHWWPARTPFEVCVGAVLTQNAAWTGVERAITDLRRSRLLTLPSLRCLTPAALTPVIRPAGCHNVKAVRLLNLVRWLDRRGGIAGLKRHPTGRLRHDLLQVTGIGPETADSILLYALGRPVFVIDAYTRRILGRYGLINGDEPYDALQSLFHRSIPPDPRRFNEYHALLVRLGKEHCRPRPLCTGCPLASD
jgi:endonuclease-3 related protein